LGANAALKYWQAFATLPRFSEDEEKVLADALNRPLDKQARDVVSKSSYSLRLLRQGAALPRCDWGIAWQELGAEVRLSHLDAARVLANLAALRARIHFADGKNSEAVEDVLAAMTLGRHVSRDAVVVCLLTGFAVEHRAAEALARDLPRLDAEAIKALRKRLDALPPGGTAAAALPYEEKSFFEWIIRQFKEAKDKESLLDLLSRFHEKSPEKGKAFLEECGGTLDGLLKAADQTRQTYARLAKEVKLPLEEFAAAWEREQKRMQAEPVTRLVFPGIVSLERVRLAQLRADLRRALLSAALAVRLDGEGALKDHPDPAAGGSFEYVPFEGGFELRSKWKLSDPLRTKWKLDKRSAQLAEPVALTVGRRK
jgi:hypothetical protein